MRIYLAVAIALVWSVSYVISVATNNYMGLQAVSPIMLLAASFLLSREINRRNGNGKR